MPVALGVPVSLGAAGTGNRSEEAWGLPHPSGMRLTDRRGAWEFMASHGVAKYRELRGETEMDFDLNEEQRALQETVRRFAEREILPRIKDEGFKRDLIYRMG